MQDEKVCFSAKHKLYGYKVEVSILPNGLALNISKHYPGSVSDLDIFCRQGRFHAECTSKKVGEQAVRDDGLLSEEFPDD